MYKIGDEVKIIDGGRIYSTYIDWFIKNCDNIEYFCRYAYSSSIKEKINYIILGKGIHETNGKMLYIISANEDYAPIFLISEDGIELVEKEMTLEEIEKALGYKIKLKN